MDDDRRRMTTDEIALMRAIITWRKAHGIEFVRRQVMGTYWVDVFGRTGAKQRCVAIELRHSPSAPMGVCAGLYDSYTWLGAETFTQAVDVLVAYGYLPQRFSSAYGAGWHAAQIWEQTPATGRRGWRGEEFARLFHDPDNISFPAGDPQ